MRRLLIGAAAGLVLSFVAVSGVSAYWHAQQRLDLGATSSGDLRVDATWRDGAPTWPALFPGRSTSDAVVRVVSRSSGTTLRWNMTISGTVSSDLQPHTSFSAWRGDCGTGTPVTLDGLKNLAPDAVFDVCIRFALASTTPGALQNQPLNPRITVSAKQATS